MSDEKLVLSRILLDGEVVRRYSAHDMVSNDFFLIMSVIIFANKIPYYDLPEFAESQVNDTFIKTIGSTILEFMKEVDYPFELDFVEKGNDYIMNIQRTPKPANLCRKIIEPLRPTDRWIILDIEAISQYFLSTTTSIPSFIRLVHEDVLIWIMRNLGSSSAHMEFILNTLQTKVLDDFDVNAYPYDNTVLDLLTSSFGAILLMLIELFSRFNLFDELGRNHWYVSEINKYEVILYDSRLRSGIP